MCIFKFLLSLLKSVKLSPPEFYMNLMIQTAIYTKYNYSLSWKQYKKYSKGHYKQKHPILSTSDKFYKFHLNLQGCFHRKIYSPEKL